MKKEITEKYEKAIKTTVVKLVDLSEQELCEIHSKLNSWEWSDKLGKEPDGFSDMPVSHDRKLFSTSVITKYDIVTPIILA